MKTNCYSCFFLPKRSLSSRQFEFKVFLKDDITIILYPQHLFQQISLIFQDTSLPTAVFIWDIQNDGDTDLEASITFTFKNGQGVKADSTGGCWSEPFHCQHKSEENGSSASDKAAVAQGVSIHQTISGQPCSYNIAAAVKVCDYRKKISPCL